MVDDLKTLLKGKVLILGIGNRFRGDDGAGPLLVKYLKGKVKNTLLDVGEEPLNYLEAIQSKAPNTILVFDTAEMGEEPGLIKRLDLEDLSNLATVSTHSIPIYQTLRLIKMRTQADIILFGIQAGTLQLGNRMSPQVENAVKKFARELVQILAKSQEV